MNRRRQRHRDKGHILSPRPIETPGASELLKEGQREKALGNFSCGAPLERAGGIDEIAAAALFLGLADSGFVHGAELFAAVTSSQRAPE
jgi:NAD(P)-dependent dehydrogenase (short-subunit alcohol dehydrogenase family)